MRAPSTAAQTWSRSKWDDRNSASVESGAGGSRKPVRMASTQRATSSVSMVRTSTDMAVNLGERHVSSRAICSGQVFGGYAIVHVVRRGQGVDRVADLLARVLLGFVETSLGIGAQPPGVVLAVAHVGAVVGQPFAHDAPVVAAGHDGGQARPASPAGPGSVWLTTAARATLSGDCLRRRQRGQLGRR